MERVTLRMPKGQLNQLEQLVETGEYPNRSEAIRSMVREQLKDRRRHEPRSPFSDREWTP